MTLRTRVLAVGLAALLTAATAGLAPLALAASAGPVSADTSLGKLTNGSVLIAGAGGNYTGGFRTPFDSAELYQ